MYKLVGPILTSDWLFRWKTMMKKILFNVNKIILRLGVWISSPMGIVVYPASKSVEYCSKTLFLRGLDDASVIFSTISRKTAHDRGHEKSRFTWPNSSKKVFLESIHHGWIISPPEHQSVAKSRSHIERFFRSSKIKFLARHNFFLDAPIRQPKVKIDPGSLYMGESRWNEVFQNVYDQFGILNRCEVLELPRKVGKFLTRSVNNVLLTREIWVVGNG